MEKKMRIEKIINQLEGLGIDIIEQEFLGAKLSYMQWRILMALISEKGGPVHISKVGVILGQLIMKSCMNVHVWSINNRVLAGNNIPKTIDILPNGTYKIADWVKKDRLEKAADLIHELCSCNVDIMKSRICNVFLSNGLFLLMISYLLGFSDILKKNRAQLYNLNKRFRTALNTDIFKFGKAIFFDPKK